MAGYPDSQGPGEHVGPCNLQGEAASGPSPDGEIPGNEMSREARAFPAKLPVRDASMIVGDAADPQVALPRTGTDLEAVAMERGEPGAPEDRLDQSVEQVPRETVFDPAQDDAGPQPDSL